MCACPCSTFFLTRRFVVFFVTFAILKLTYTFLFLKLISYIYKLFLLVCNCSLRSLASSRICLGLLTTNRESFTMTDTSVASDLLQSLDVKGDFPSQITFYCHCLINNSAQSLNLVISQISDTCVSIHQLYEPCTVSSIFCF